MFADRLGSLLQILITRPLAKARDLARLLESRGHAVLIEPLLTIEQLRTALDLSDVQAIALTSANAVPAIDDACRNLPVFAVGDACAAAATRAGCTRVEAADGDAPSLARRIAASCQPEAGAILHLCGAVVREGLDGPLTEAGFRFVRQTVYRAHAAESLHEQTQQKLRQGMDAVLLFSPRTAEVFSKLVVAHGLDRCLATTVACCLSEAVADGCRHLAWRGVVVAARSDKAAILEALEAMDRRW